MKEIISKRHNNYWVWDYGAVVPFHYETMDEDGNLLKNPVAILKVHIGREELEEYIEILQYALEKKKKWLKENLKPSNNSNSNSENFNFILGSDLADYAGQWIAVFDNKVIANDENLSKVMKATKAKSRNQATIMKVPRKDTINIM